MAQKIFVRASKTLYRHFPCYNRLYGKNQGQQTHVHRFSNLNMNIQKWETSEEMKKNIEHIKEWIRKQPHLPQEYDEIWLENFLLGCKLRVERCKTLLDRFYTTRNVFPQYFTNRDPTTEEIRNISGKQFRFLLPEHSPDGYSVFISSISDPSTPSYLCEEDIKKLMMTRDAAILTGRLEIILVLDCKYFTTAHIPAFLYNIKDLVTLVVNAVPIRVKQIHVVNTNKFGKVAYSAVLPLLKKKLKNRFHIHTTDLQSLHEHIPKKILPIEYGGEAGTMKDLNDEWQKKLESLKHWFLADEKRKTDESKRVKCNVNNDMFGVEGSFKTLSID